MDPWYPLGRGSMLDALSMLVHVAQMTGRNELFRAYEMVTTNPARAAEVPYGIAEGKPANFVVFDCADEAEAIRLRPAARLVVRNGRVVAETEPARSVVHVDGRAQPVTFRRDGVGPDGSGTGGGIGGPSTPEMAGAGPNRAIGADPQPRTVEGAER
jgi:cytosine deaminase